jgi:hypothetical protein
MLCRGRPTKLLHRTPPVASGTSVSLKAGKLTWRQRYKCECGAGEFQQRSPPDQRIRIMTGAQAASRAFRVVSRRSQPIMAKAI